jgi:hypothetical protein
MKNPKQITSINIIAFCTFYALLMSSCSQSDFSLFASPIPTSPSISTFTFTTTSTQTPTVTFTPTITLTPTITPTATSTVPPTPTMPPIANCENNTPRLASWAVIENGIALFEAYTCPDDILVAIFRNQDIPESLKVNIRTVNNLEYEWGVYVDVDANKETGTSSRNSTGITGTDNILSMTRWSHGVSKTLPFADAFQVNTWICGHGCGNSGSGKDCIDRDNKLLILSGWIRGINAKSQLIFIRNSFLKDKDLNYKTDWIISNTNP